MIGEVIETDQYIDFQSYNEAGIIANVSEMAALNALGVTVSALPVQ